MCIRDRRQTDHVVKGIARPHRRHRRCRGARFGRSDVHRRDRQPSVVADLGTCPCRGPGRFVWRARPRGGGRRDRCRFRDGCRPCGRARPCRCVRSGIRGRSCRQSAYAGRFMKSGFACFVGRPNAGKSTLTNALVGEKVAITSSRPQTTRHAIRGLVNREGAQLILVDTPGLHKPRTLLGERLNDLVRTTWSEVDTIGLCLPSDEKIGPGDRFLMKQLAGLRKKPILAIATKTDLVAPDRLAEHLMDIQTAGAAAGIDWRDIVPVSAQSGSQVELLVGLLINTLPEGPQLYPDGHLTDEPEETLVAEFIREAALEGVRDELPHSIAVVIDEMVPRADRPDDKPLMDVRAHIFVERDSQKGIIIGKKGARLREIGTTSRVQIERILGTPVFLDLQVTVAKEWQRDLS